MVAALLHRSSLRFFKRHPTQLILSILGIILGVAIVTAVLITNTSSNTAFRLSANAITGTTTHQIMGAEFGVPQAFYAQLRRQQSYAMAPIIEGYLRVDGELLTLLGIDPFASAGLQATQLQLTAGSVAPLITSDHTVLISERTHARLNLQWPQSNQITLETDVNGIQGKLKLAGIYRSQNPAATDGLLITDIAVAQHLLSRDRYIDRIDLVLTDAEATELAEALPVSLRLISSATRSTTMSDMTRGFQINLTAMSLLALLVGAFLIHNTMTFSILQRRELFATLRIVGVTSAGIFASIMTETFVISLIGSLLGIAAGYQIAHFLIRLTTQTINDLYFVLHVQQVWFSAWLGAAIVCLGVATSLIAAAASATEAATISPIQARMRSRLEVRTDRVLPLLALAGLILMLVGFALALWPGESLVLGFAALMALIMGYGLCIPWLVAFLTNLFRIRSSIVMAFSLGGIQRSISRTGVAIAALAIAVSATFGVDIMIGSFRSTVDTWLGKTLQSDIYISAPSSGKTRTDGDLAPPLVKQIVARDSIQDWSSGKTINVFSSVGQVDMLVLAPHTKSKSGFDFIAGESVEVWADFLNTDSIVISEPLATKNGLQRGDTIRIFTANEGDKNFAIAGVYYDYGSSHGRITMSRTTHDRYWQDRSVSSIGLNLLPGEDPQSTLNALRQLLKQQPQQLLIRSNSDIRKRSLEVFDRTFQVTRVLRLLTVGVAFIGIFSALLALQMERAKEFAILRASGATGREVALIVMLQTLIMGVLAGVIALPLGWIMSEVLIHVINLRSFGWSMQSMIPPGSVSSTLLLSISSAILAGLYPAWRLGSQSVALQLRDE